MIIVRLLAAACLVAVPCAGVRATAQETAPAPAPRAPYADLADLVLAAPVIVDATVRSTARIKGEEAARVPPGLIRLYVTADVAALVRGADGLAPRIGYLVDLPLDPRGRPPKLNKARLLLFARVVPGAGDQLQLVAPDAQLPWTAATDATVRAIATEAVSTDAPPEVTGIGNAFHVPGALPGEGETQIFLRTADERPVSLSVLRRPGEEPRWAVALSEIVDESAAPPRAETLLWYRLACGLPSALPSAATASLEPRDAGIAAEDYRFVLDRLGPCGRTRGAAGPVSAGDAPT